MEKQTKREYVVIIEANSENACDKATTLLLGVADAIEKRVRGVKIIIEDK